VIYISGRGIQVLGAGTIINPIIKIVTTVAILAAVGIFIVRPVLDTTEDAIDKASQQSQAIRDSVDQSITDSQIDSMKSRAKSYASSLASGWPAAAIEVRNCAKEAGEDFQALNFCVNFGQRLVTQVQANRSRALSYADSLGAQGRSAEADQVEACVKDAGFATATMRRCFNLADKLLFG
jgi:hypothetical protein